MKPTDITDVAFSHTHGDHVGNANHFAGATLYTLLVRLPKRGPVILSGDMVHLQDNWVAKRVPSFNFDREQSLRSMEKVAAIMSKTGAELWINHDKAHSDKIPKSPDYVE